MPPPEFETAISVGKLSDILALDRAATGIGILLKYVGKFASDYDINFFLFPFVGEIACCRMQRNRGM
jgi:hypothetical protein